MVTNGISSTPVTVAVGTPGCVVPKVTGKALAAAKRSIKQARCSVGKITQGVLGDGEVRPVISQKPRPGKRLAVRSPVKITVSKGKRTR